MASKEAFLQRIAHKLGRERIHEVKPPQYFTHPWDDHFSGWSQKALIHHFKLELEAVGGEVIHVPSIQALRSAIWAWCQKESIQQAIAWQHQSEWGQGLTLALQELNNDTSHKNAHSYGESHLQKEQFLKDSHTQPNTNVQITLWDEEANKDTLIQAAEQADVGFTVADFGMAETGSVVIKNRGHCGRLVSLLPSISATILPTSHIVPRLTHVLHHMPEVAQDHSCINIITGPSRSADIEMDLSIGVHGPGHTVVFIVDNHS